MAPTDPSAAAARATPADVPPHPPAEPLLRDAPLAVLIGPMAAGKSSVGRALAKLLGASFADLDLEIVARAGADIPALFAERGEEGFRALEEETLADLLETHSGVLSLGGGAPLRPASRDRLRAHRVVLLEIDERTASRRLRGGAGRPLLAASSDPLETWRTLRDARIPHYRALSRCQVDGGAGSPAAVARRVAAVLSALERTAAPHAAEPETEEHP